MTSLEHIDGLKPRLSSEATFGFERNHLVELVMYDYITFLGGNILKHKPSFQSTILVGRVIHSKVSQIRLVYRVPIGSV